MGKLSKFFLITGIIFLTIVIALYLVYITKLKADNIFCQEQLMQPNKNSDFFALLEKVAEGGNEGDVNEEADSTPYTWRDMDIVYMIFNVDGTKEIYENPTKYFSDALKVIASADFDQSQKIYSILMMQELPIREYMCLMDTANTAYENSIITDKEVLIQAIRPDLNLQGTSNYYWWLPDWQQRFNKHANELFSQDHIDLILSGDYGNMWRTVKNKD